MEVLSRIWFTALILGIISINSTAQQSSRCGSRSYEALIEKRFPSYHNRKSRLEETIAHKKLLRTSQTGTVTIPVVVHIIYNTSQSNIPDERVYAQIRILNEDYRRANEDSVNTPSEFIPFAADSRIEFCLATRDPSGNVTTGILRKRTSVTSFQGYDVFDEDVALKSLSYWPSDQYLNIWVTTLSNNVLGYAWYPASGSIPDLNDEIETGLDGVVIHHAAFGPSSSPTYKYNKGRTTTHEVGHWLGLRHIWGDSRCGEDFVDDTPQQEDDNATLARNGDCMHFSACGGLRARDMSANYMDYSPDNCMNLFTQGQAVRMQTVLQSNPRRIALFSSAGCCNPPVVASLPFFQGFENTTFTEEGWSVYNPDQDNTWQRINKGAFGESAYSLYVNNGAGNRSRPDQLITLPLDFTTATDPVLEFSVAHTAGTGGRTDSLEIGYNANCKKVMPLAVIPSDQLFTAVSRPGFIPRDEEWKKIRISLKSLAGKAVAQLYFTNYSLGNNNLYIDDINIYNSQPEVTMKIYPNPATDELFAEIGAAQPSEVSFQLYNSIGQLVAQWKDLSKNFKKRIFLEGLTPGMYILKGTVKDRAITRKFLVQW